MASRFAKKPDPAIKQNVLRSRAAARKTNKAQASVVATSIAATLFAWVSFSSHDAQMIEAARKAQEAQATTLTVERAEEAPVAEGQPQGLVFETDPRLQRVLSILAK